MGGRMLLAVDGVACDYGAAPVLDGVTFQVAPGEVIGLVGPNGAGKTSLLKVLAGLLAPSRGSVHLDGRDLRLLGAGERARDVAAVPSEGSRDLLFTVEEAVALGRLPHQRPLRPATAADRAAVRQALAAAALEGLAGRPLCQLSGGEAQRVLLARALAQEPRVLLMDEPTAHLDLGHQVAFLELVCGLARRRGLVAVAALHDLNLAALFADRLLLLSRGEVVAAGPPEAVLTAERIAGVYGVDVVVQPHPATGRPQVLIAAPATGPADVAAATGPAGGEGGGRRAHPPPRNRWYG